MEENGIKKDSKEIDFLSVWRALFKNKYLFIKTIVATFVLACLYTLSLHNYYAAGVALAPEVSGKNSASGGLSSLASSFGVSLGSLSSGEDALSPSLYPDMMNSVEFKTRLFSVQVHELNNDESYSYYEYIKNHQKLPWWSAGLKAFFGLFGSKKAEEATTVNPFMLTREQHAIIKKIEKKIGCSVDKKTNVIYINVIDQDPLVAATMADSVKQHLQDVITAYRTSKARVDLEYNKKLYEETKAKYDVARQEYATYADANLDVILQRDRNKLLELENEMQLRYQAYSSVSAQLQAAEAKVQQETPAFTTLQSATVPVRKDGPGRSRIVIIYCFFVGVFTCIYVLHKEGYLVPLILLALGLDKDKGKKAARIKQ